MNTYVSKKNQLISFGHQRDNLATTVKFPAASIYKNFGEGGQFHAWVRRPTDIDAYPHVVTVDDTYVSLTFTATDTQFAGSGQIQIDYIKGDIVANSKIYTFEVEESLNNTEDVPAPYVAWVTEVEGYAASAASSANEAHNYADNAAASASASANSAAAALASKNAAAVSAAAAAESQNNAAGSEAGAAIALTAAHNSAVLSESWAKGGTGTRPGEETNNAKYWSERAEAIAGNDYVSYSVVQTPDESQKKRARQNMSAESSVCVPITALASGWSSTAPYTITINNAAIHADSVPVALLDVSEAGTLAAAKTLRKNFSKITYLDTYEGSVNLTAKFEKPDVNLYIFLKGV